MTNNIYPPDHLLRKWESLIIDEEQNVDVVLYESFQAGADQELEACCEWLFETGYRGTPMSLRAARRPKPLSLKEQSIALIDKIQNNKEMWQTDDLDIVRRALESLPS